MVTRWVILVFIIFISSMWHPWLMTKWHGCLIVITMTKKWLQVIWYEHKQPSPALHLPMYLPIYIPTHPSINLPTCLPTKPPTYHLPNPYLLIYLLTHPPTHPLMYLPIHPPTYFVNLPTYLPTFYFLEPTHFLPIILPLATYFIVL
jgi:hypothetical protein